MSDHVRQTLELVQKQIAELDESISHKKRMANDLCELAGMPALYHDIDVNSSNDCIRPDQFYGRPLSTVAGEVLTMRGTAATVAEIFEALSQGGYEFGSTTTENAKRSLRISLTKNSSKFHKLPNGTYGLIDWYDNVKTAKSKKQSVDGEPATALPENVDPSREAGDFGESQAGDTDALEMAKARKG